MSGLDRRTTGVIFTIRAHNIVIKPQKSKGEKRLSGTDGILELKRSEKITSAVVVSKDNKTSFKKSSITGNGEKKSGRNATLSQSVFGVKQGGSFL
ncbi:hypothetical protein [Bartonella sp. AP19HLJMH]|uniref:hypothetical protein n=1 Tax=Bartonella sp. AP19HLJMH TaxID=3243473 RepID=UPI0035CE99A8